MIEKPSDVLQFTCRIAVIREDMYNALRNRPNEAVPGISKLRTGGAGGKGKRTPYRIPRRVYKDPGV